ncbi:hypothetical protein R1flu_002408 [Riccia fluitans]|uniref:Uncharacterized protein n=1 Tax=Riccia fluitans TaxID=41844 RepID=A0ABD1Y6B3_9MARC
MAGNGVHQIGHRVGPVLSTGIRPYGARARKALTAMADPFSSTGSRCGSNMAAAGVGRGLLCHRLEGQNGGLEGARDDPSNGWRAVVVMASSRSIRSGMDASIVGRPLFVYLHTSNARLMGSPAGQVSAFRGLWRITPRRNGDTRRPGGVRPALVRCYLDVDEPLSTAPS